MANSYPIDGTVVDQDGSTAVSGANVVAVNTTTGEKTSEKTNSSGQFIIDLANLASAYSNADRIQITASYGSGSGKRSLSKRHTVNTVIGSISLGTIILHAGEEPFITTNITFAAHTNSSAGGLYVDYYDRTNDVKVFRIETIAGASLIFSVGYLGIKMDGGFIRIFESETAGSSEALTVFK